VTREEATPRTEAPASAAEAARILAAAEAERLSVRPRGGGTKLGWGTATPEPDVALSTERLDRIVEHNAADLVAVVQAGVPMARLQALLGQDGLMLALDPPLGPGDAATVGGVVATGDTGPLRHRYGGPRDLLLGITVALSDGTVAASGGKVIKNVAGYDLAKLFAGSFGTLGLIVQVAVRLHPVPARRLTVVGSTDRPDDLRRAALALARAPLELECLDVAWEAGHGVLLARCAGAAPERRAPEAIRIMSEAGLEADAREPDEEVWEALRARQRSAAGTVVRVAGLPAGLATVVRAADRAGASVAGRAGGGLWWLSVPPGSTAEAVGAIEDLRRELPPCRTMVVDAPREIREKVDVWGEQDAGALALMRRVKAGFDPAGTCNPGLFVGGM
jgi:glycolate oxidase FAD binding subunit